MFNEEKWVAFVLLKSKVAFYNNFLKKSYDVNNLLNLEIVVFYFQEWVESITEMQDAVDIAVC